MERKGLRMQGTPRGINHRRRLRRPVIWLLGLLLGTGSLVESSWGQAPPVVENPWLHIYVRNRRQAVALETAGQLVRQQRYPEAAAQIQFLFDQPHDSWLVEPQGELASVREQGWLLLANDAGPFLESYRRLIGPDARQLLAQAKADQDLPRYLDVVRRYFATAEGYEAAEWLIRYWLDDGDWNLAAGLAQRVLNSKLHQRQVSPRFLHMAAVAFDLAEWAAEAEQVRSQLTERVASRNPTVTAADAGRRFPAARNAEQYTPEVTPPVLAADWTIPLASSQLHPQAESVLQEWVAAQREKDQSTAVGWAPVLAGDLLMVRELDEVRAIQIASGQVQWRYRTQTSLGNLLISTEVSDSRARFRGAMWDAAAANSLVSGLSTDGRRVYFVDQSETLLMSGIYGLESQTMPQFSRRDAARNSLVALDLHEPSHQSRLVWSTGTSSDVPRLAGHAFLGPPLALAGTLYAISEHDRELCLTAFQSATGRILWQQPLAESERSSIEDRGRNTRACQPVAAGDLILCPTNIGLLVAVDAVTGTLRWTHNSLEATPDRNVQRFRTISTLDQRRHASFPGTPRVWKDRVVYLPSQSQHLYCLDLSTGKELWQVSHPLVEFVALADDEQVIAVGHTAVKAYASHDGSPRWTTLLPSVVSGYGVEAAPNYVVPLDSGRVAAIDLKTGRLRNSTSRLTSAYVGHLTATSDRIVSVGPKGIAAFPQTKTLQQRLTIADNGPARPARFLALAEVHLAEGNVAAAVKVLESAWSQLPDGDERQRIRSTLWEVYFELVRDDPENSGRWLARLKPLLSHANARQKARWLILALADAEARKDRALIGEYFLQLAEDFSDGSLFECPGEQDLEISGLTWLQLVLSRLPDAVLRDELVARLTAHAAADPTSAWGLVAERILDDELATPLRLQQADAAIAANELQRAAVLLQRADRHSDPELLARADLALMRLFADAELPLLASRTLERYRQRTQLDLSAVNLKALFGDSAHHELTLAAWQRSQPATAPAGQVRIVARARPMANLGDVLAGGKGSTQQHEPYEDYQRSIAAVPAEGPLEWMTRNTARGTEVGIFDKVSSRKICEHVLPFGSMASNARVDLSWGTLVPFSMSGEIRALSPLQGDREFVAWKLELPEWTRRSAQASGGPATARIALFQWKNVLFAVDPAYGRLLWRRNDLESNSGLFIDPRIGLLATDSIVFILGQDKTNYRVLDLTTGRELRTGRLDQDSRFARYDLGNAILYIHDSGEQRQIRVWDPETDSLLLEDSIRTRQLISRFTQDKVAWLTGDSRLKIFSATSRQILIDVPLPTSDITGAATLKVFSQNGWHLVSIGRNQPTAHTNHFQLQLPERSMPGEVMRDELLAIGPDGKEIRWRKSIPNRTLLQVGEAEVPLLLAGCLIRDKRDANRRWLRIEAWDLESGRILGIGDQLNNDKLLYADYDGPAGKITLLGRQTEIEIDFSQPRRLPPIDPGPL